MEIKDVTSLLGMKEAKTIEEFKAEFESKYSTAEQFLKSDVIQAHNGKLLGSVQTGINRIGRAYGIEFTKEETTGKTVEDITEMLLKKKTDAYEAQITELKSLAEKGNDDKVKDLQTRYEKLESKYKDTEKAWKSTVSEFDTFKQTAAQQVKGVKLDFVRSNVWNGIKFDPSVDALKKKGFEAMIKEQYVIDLDETDTPFIATKEGHRIKNPSRTDQFMTVEEVLNSEAEKAGLTAKNPNAGRPAFFTPNQGAAKQEDQARPLPGRKIAARAKV